MAIDKEKSKVRKTSRGVTIPKRAWDSDTILKVTQAQREHSPIQESESAKTTVVVRRDPYIRRSELVQFLKENLKIEVMGGGFTDPNNRQIRVFVEDECITTASFDVVQKREYEG